MNRLSGCERRLVWLSVVALGVSAIVTQLALTRELLTVFSGNELVLGVVLGTWLLLMGIGAWLGKAAARTRHPLASLIVLQVSLALLPLVQVFLLRALRNVVFIRGAAVDVTDTASAVFVLLLPYCLLAGAALTVACAILARGDGAAGAGRVYVADSVGSVLGGALFCFVLIRWFDHAGSLVFPAVLNLLAAAALGYGAGYRRSALLAGLLATAVTLLATTTNLDAISTRLQFPGQHVVARANSPYGKLLVTESDGQLDFIENGIPLISTRDDQHVEEVVHYPMAQRPEARTVLLVAGGLSGTANEFCKYPVRRVDYVEPDPALLALGRRFLPQNLTNSRLRIINTDARQFVRHTNEKYDVIVIDLPAPGTTQLNRFFTEEFFAEAKRALAPRGVISFGLGHYENYVSPELGRLLASAARSLRPSFKNVLALPGAQVFLLASDGPLFEDVAPRLAAAGVPTKLMNRHYLDAMLTPDRLADLRRALAQPAAANTDFSPRLYDYEIRHWLSQFEGGFGVFQGLLLLVLGAYLACLRGTALVLFASGFAGSALELVLLLQFQILCGSVYYQMGIIFTVFMAGLALGAAWPHRNQPATILQRTNIPPPRATPSPAPPRPSARLELPKLSIAIAGFALCLPAVLPALSRTGAIAASLWPVQLAVVTLTLLLALLLGRQFQVANRREFDGTVAVAARLYTADFVGACLGALLAGTWLIPLLGVAGICLFTAALNLLAGFLFLCRKAQS